MFVILLFIVGFHQGLCSIIFSEADISNILQGHTIQSTYIPNLLPKQHVRNSSVCHHFALKLSHSYYDICAKILKLSYPGLIDEMTQIRMPLTNISVSVDSLSLDMVSGYVEGMEDVSFIKGYLHEDRFFGKIHIGGETYYIEPAKHFDVLKNNPHSNDAIIYQKPNVSFFDEVNGTFSLGFEIFNINMGIDLGRPQKVNGFETDGDPGKNFNFTILSLLRRKLCVITIVLDSSFVQVFGDGDIQVAMKKILLNFDEVNAILRSADFDNDRVPDNVGISIGLIAALESSNKTLGAITMLPIDQPVNPLDVLQKFAMVTLVRRSCLNILLIGHPFIEQFLGVSFTATKNIFDRFKHVGICGGHSIFIPSLNALVVTYRFGDGKLLPKPLVDVNLVHEIGHSFGSEHDSGTCLEGYIMSPRTAIPSTLINFEFSPCSKRDISIVLRKQGDCLVDTQDTYCGNAIVEKGEDCDCGSSYHCSLRDPCCHPRDSKNQCKVRKAYQCHPSEDLCCTTNCTYKNLKDLGLDCSNIRNKCPCTRKDCTCGMSGTCVGDECHSFECTRIGLKECECPISNMNFCQTCCLDTNGTCLPSQILANILITTNPNFTLQSDVTFINVSGQKMEMICNDNGCFHLNFHQFPQNGFCTRFGKLGVCTRSRCVLPAYVSTRTPSARKATPRSSASIFGYLSLWVMVLVLIYVL